VLVRLGLHLWRTKLINSNFTNELSFYFFYYCPKSIKDDAAKLASEFGEYALVLPFLWAQHHLPEFFEHAFKVEFTYSPNTFYGFDFEEVTIKDVDLAKKIVLSAGQDFARGFKYERIYMFANDVCEYLKIGRTIDHVCFFKALQHIFKFRLNQNGLGEAEKAQLVAFLSTGETEYIAVKPTGLDEPYAQGLLNQLDELETCFKAEILALAGTPDDPQYQKHKDCVELLEGEDEWTEEMDKWTFSLNSTYVEADAVLFEDHENHKFRIIKNIFGYIARPLFHCLVTGVCWLMCFGFYLLKWVTKIK
jgi:hypothetical protein